MMVTWLRKKSPVSALIVNGTDGDFDAVYPRSIRSVAEQHFTPLAVASRAAKFLVTRPGTKVLDIGSGAGKFCLIGASVTQGIFTGVEQRESLVSLSDRIARQHGVSKVRFIHANVMSIDLTAFDAFYFFNPFFENVNSGKRIDSDVLLNPSLFESYSSYMSRQLSALPARTRLATYYTSPQFVGRDFQLMDSSDDGHLLLWEKPYANGI
jgi:cyclopropane fatty-acyl-phospholipid synthase-like methyltransferase